jgi:hypothetical protein
MSDNVVDLPTQELPPFLVGPFREWRVVVEGRFVPGLTGWVEGDRIWLCVDNRFGSSFSTEADARNAASLIAEAMAVAHGYPHFSAPNKDMPFAAIATEMAPPA